MEIKIGKMFFDIQEKFFLTFLISDSNFYLHFFFLIKKIKQNEQNIDKKSKSFYNVQVMTKLLLQMITLSHKLSC